MSRYKHIILPIVVLTSIAIIVTVLLSLTNHFTKPVIDAAAAEKANAARKIVLADADTFTLIELPEDIAKELHVRDVYEADNGAGFAVTVSVKGYADGLTVMFGIDPEGKIAGVDVLQHGETKGIGDRVTKPEFKDRFLGKKGDLTAGKDIDILANATYSSKGMVAAANCALDTYQYIKEGSLK